MNLIIRVQVAEPMLFLVVGDGAACHDSSLEERGNVKVQRLKYHTWGMSLLLYALAQLAGRDGYTPGPGEGQTKEAGKEANRAALTALARWSPYCLLLSAVSGGHS